MRAIGIGLAFLFTLVSHAGDKLKTPPGFMGTVFHGDNAISDFEPVAALDTASKEVKDKLSQSSEGNAKLLFDHYCQSKSPVRKMIHSIKLILPKSYPGTPLSTARSHQDQALTHGRKAVQAFYDSAAFSWKPKSKGKGSTELSHYGLYFFGVKTNSPDGLRDLFKEETLARQDEVVRDQFNFMATEKEVLLFYAAKGKTKKIFLNRSLNWREDRAVGYPNFQRKFFIASDKIETDDDQELHPLIAFQAAELVFWTRHLVLFPSEAAAKDLVPNHAGLFAESRPTRIADAVEQKDGVWTEYLRQSVKVKEEPSEDPQVISFALELDLSGMCRWARPVGDLVTK